MINESKHAWKIDALSAKIIVLSKSDETGQYL
jgi:hypothetical protein